MKQLIFILGCLSLATSNLKEQIEKVSVPKVKETPPIDEVLKKSLKDGFKENCFFILEFKGEENLHVSSVKITSSYFNLYNVSYKGVEYFEYQNHIIFVVGATSPNRFFKKTSDSTVFYFLNNEGVYNGDNIWKSKDYKLNFRNLDFLKWQNDRFVSKLEPVY